MNNLEFLMEVVTLLDAQSVKTWIFGGWAEELLGVILPRAHKDVDLFYPSQDFVPVDSFIERNKDVEEIKDKWLPHKRAFIFKGVMVELFLVENDNLGHFTNFWDTKKHYWPADLFSHTENNLRLVSQDTLLSYRTNFDTLRK